MTDLPYDISLLAQTNGALFGQVIAVALDDNFEYLFELIGGGSGGAVISVNGKTGVVVLAASDVGAQAANANLTSLAGLTGAADTVAYFTGTSAMATAAFTGAGRTFLAATTVALQRTALALGTSAITNTGTSAGNVVVLDGSARLPAVDGSQLTNLPAGTITSSQITTALGYTPTSVTGLTGPQTVGGFKAGLSLVSSDVGLGNCNNTSDANKPVSTAQAAAIALKLTASANLSDIASASLARGNLGSTTVGDALFTSTSTSSAQSTLGLGTAATQNVGTSAGNVVQLVAGAKLPAVDGSLLTNLPGGGGGPVLLATLTASSSASLSDTSHLTSTYNHYKIVFQNVLPSAGGPNFKVLFSVNGGSSYLATGYSGSDGATTSIVLTDINNTFALVSNASGGINGEIDLINPNATQAYGCQLSGSVSVFDTTPGFIVPSFLCGGNSTTSAVNAIQFLFSTGNIASGIIKIYGVP